MTDQNKIFISYRRSISQDRARLIFRELRERGYDVFLDITTIDNGAFDRIILNQIAARPHFLLILSPGSLERCVNEGDWLRREIEEAFRLKRNIVPVFDEKFDIEHEKHFLPEPLRSELPRLNAPPYSHYYFDAFIETICTRFLKPPVYDIPITPPPAAEQAEVQRRIDDITQTLPVLPLSSVEEESQSDIFTGIRPYVSPPASPHEDNDELYAEALELVRSLNRVSVSLLQRRLRIGYTRAERLVDRLQEEGVIGPAKSESLATEQTKYTLPRHIVASGLGDEVSVAAAEGLRVNATFNGQRNRDWQPFIATFDDLKISNMPFCFVPPGSFQMGSNDSRYDDEKPQHQQTITKPYWIAQYPVTNAQWKQAVQSKAVDVPRDKESLRWYHDLEMANAPIVGINWFEARRFAAWLGCYLPSELEWEYAARGVESWVYPWGNEWRSDFCIWRDNSDGKPADVQSKPQGMSWVGAWHLSGNVWERTRSLYQSYPYIAGDAREGDADNRTGIQRVLRGGSFLNLPDFGRAAYRSYHAPFRRFSIGFRVVCRL